MKKFKIVYFTDKACETVVESDSYCTEPDNSILFYDEKTRKMIAWFKNPLALVEVEGADEKE